MAIVDLPEEIQKHILETVVKTKEYESNHFYITELIGCPRMVFYNRTIGRPSKMAIDKAYQFYFGIVLDDLWTKLFKVNQRRVTHKVYGYPITVSGRLDFIDSKGVICDLKKTANLFFVQKEAKPEHISQIMFYCYCEANYKAKLCYFSLKNYIEHSFTFTDEELSQFINDFVEPKAINISNYISTNTVPDSEKTKKDWECHYTDKETGVEFYCDYYDRCYPEKKAEDSD